MSVELNLAEIADGCVWLANRGVEVEAKCGAQFYFSC
jgi:hypothetical protein